MRRLATYAALGMFALGISAMAAWAQPHVAPVRAASRGVQQTPERFPHAKHAGLFPLCSACHADIASSDQARRYPDAASCRSCHNGTDAKPVTWSVPAVRTTQGLLAFQHRPHFAKTDSIGRACTNCHAAAAPASGRRYMDVGTATEPTCRSCHAHRATEHHAPDAKCVTCHVTLDKATALSVAQIAALPKPPSHTAAAFKLSHVEASTDLLQCATCHTRESCARCHVNAGTLKEIRALPSDDRVALALKGKPPEWPVPVTHAAEGFASGHGELANAATATCANCHARSSCTACHTSNSAASAIKRLPDPRNGARGVQLVNPLRALGSFAHTADLPRPDVADTGRRVVRAHAEGYLEAHRSEAAAGTLTCESCHTRRFCSDCHAGEARRSFHPVNFAYRHATSVYSEDSDCASCHNTEVFCRECHKAVGISSKIGRNGAFHTAQPNWLLQHGRAARQDLVSCSTCHQQQSCMRCHSTTGWGVSPHGADFNAERLGKKAMAMCARCHLTDPRRR